MSAVEHATPRPVIVCALDFERKAIERAGLGDRAEVICTGPGQASFVKWAESRGPNLGRVILVGLAGSMRETMRPGEAFVASTVISPEGEQRRSALDLAEHFDVDARPRRAVIASAEHLLTSPSEKRAWTEKTGADLVDLEAGIFAKAATIFGWRWDVVKGVSDGVTDRLPSGVMKWVDDRGRTRPLRVLASILRRPWIVPGLMRLRRASRQALREACAIAGKLIS